MAVNLKKMKKAKDDSENVPFIIDGTSECQAQLIAELERIRDDIISADLKADTIYDDIKTKRSILLENLLGQNEKIAQWKAELQVESNPVILQLKQDLREMKAELSRRKMTWEIVMQKIAMAARLFKREDINLQLAGRSGL